MAWLRLEHPFAMTPHLPAQLIEGLYQRDFQGRTVFQHRNHAKWAYRGPNPRVPRFEHEDACLALLEELQELWNGVVFRPPPVSEAALRSAAALQQVRWFDYQKIGDRSRRLEFRSANRIGEGRGDDAFYWWVAEDAEGLVLGIEGRRQTECRLRRRADGSWFGRSAVAEALEVELQPVGGPASLPRSDPPLGVAEVPEAARGLLARLLASTGRQAADGEAIRDLIGALRLLAASEPGFAGAMAERLASAGDRDDPLLRCLAAALAEAAEYDTSGAARRHGYRYGDPRPSLAENYDRLR